MRALLGFIGLISSIANGSTVAILMLEQGRSWTAALPFAIAGAICVMYILGTMRKE